MLSAPPIALRPKIGLLGHERQLVDRHLRDEVPVDDVAVRFVDAHAVLVDRDALRRARHRRGREAAIVEVALERVAGLVAERDAGQLAIQPHRGSWSIVVAEIRRGEHLGVGRHLVAIDQGRIEAARSACRRCRGDCPWRWPRPPLPEALPALWSGIPLRPGWFSAFRSASRPAARGRSRRRQATGSGLVHSRAPARDRRQSQDQGRRTPAPVADTVLSHTPPQTPAGVLRTFSPRNACCGACSAE